MHTTIPTILLLTTLPSVLATPNWWPFPTSDCDKSTTKQWPTWSHPTPTTTPCDETTTLPPVFSETTTPCSTSIIAVTSTESICPGCSPASTSTYPVSESIPYTSSIPGTSLVPTSSATLPISTEQTSLSVSESYSLSVTVPTTTTYEPTGGLNSTLTTVQSSATISVTSVGVSASPTQQQTSGAKALKGEGMGNVGLGLVGLVVGMWML